LDYREHKQRKAEAAGKRENFEAFGSGTPSRIAFAALQFGQVFVVKSVYAAATSGDAFMRVKYKYGLAAGRVISCPRRIKMQLVFVTRSVRHCIIVCFYFIVQRSVYFMELIAIDEFNRSVSGANIAGNIDNAWGAAFS